LAVSLGTQVVRHRRHNPNWSCHGQ